MELNSVWVELLQCYISSTCKAQKKVPKFLLWKKAILRLSSASGNLKGSMSLLLPSLSAAYPQTTLDSPLSLSRVLFLLRSRERQAHAEAVSRTLETTFSNRKISSERQLLVWSDPADLLRNKDNKCGRGYYYHIRTDFGGHEKHSSCPTDRGLQGQGGTDWGISGGGNRGSIRFPDNTRIERGRMGKLTFSQSFLFVLNRVGGWKLR